MTVEDETDKLSRNVGKELPLFVASQPRRAQISSNSRRKLEITCFFLSLLEHNADVAASKHSIKLLTRRNFV